MKSDDGTAEYTDVDGFTTTISTGDAYLEWAKSLGDYSLAFKGCYSGMEDAFYRLWLYLLHFGSFGNYFFYLIPNMLSYALFFN